MPEMNDDTVCIVGAGYVGLVTAACLAETGRTVQVVEIDPVRLASLQAGKAPIHEPGLDELLTASINSGRLSVTDQIAEGVNGAGIVIIAVGTPPTEFGDADLSAVREAITTAAEHAAKGTVVAIKSTVPPGTTVAMQRAIARSGLSVVMCPEFLREGAALHDFSHPTRLVVGGEDRGACERVAALFGHVESPVIITDSTSAELIKYGTNAFLALKISFINEIAYLCELTGGEVDAVADGMGHDPRVGRSFLNAGLGFGGSCFPKDVRALEATAGYHGHSFWMLKSAIEVNAQQRRRFVAKVREAIGGPLDRRSVAVLGLAFKPGTDDMRQAPAIDVIRHLQDLGARITATDPVAMEKAAPLLPGTKLVDDPYECVRDADAIILVTEWDEYRKLDWSRIADLVRGRVVIDGRNCLDGGRLVALGFSYRSVGRPALVP
jgi:UDPglucose 6-dehydrogenase